MRTLQEKQEQRQRMLAERDLTIEGELWAGDQANTPHEERAVRELYRRRLRIEELEAALRPFAKHAQFFPSHEDDEHFDCNPRDENFAHVDSEVTVGDLRRAAKALEIRG